MSDIPTDGSYVDNIEEEGDAPYIINNKPSDLREILERCMSRGGVRPTNEEIASAALMTEQKIKDLQEQLEQHQTTINMKEKYIGGLHKQLEQSKREAESLALSLHKRHYKNESPNFELCDSVAGVISQIDNMTSGLGEQLEQCKANHADMVARNAALRDRPDIPAERVKSVQALVEQLEQKEILLNAELKHSEAMRNKNEKLEQVVEAAKWFVMHVRPPAGLQESERYKQLEEALNQLNGEEDEYN